jgi:hypothetical protein
MHYLSLVDHKGFLGNPQAEMHVLLGEQDGGATRSRFPLYLGDGGDDDRGQPLARLIQQQDQGIAHQGARRFVSLFEQAHSGHWLVFALILEIAVGEG